MTAIVLPEHGRAEVTRRRLSEPHWTVNVPRQRGSGNAPTVLTISERWTVTRFDALQADNVLSRVALRRVIDHVFEVYQVQCARWSQFASLWNYDLTSHVCTDKHARQEKVKRFEWSYVCKARTKGPIFNIATYRVFAMTWVRDRCGTGFYTCWGSEHIVDMLNMLTCEVTAVAGTSAFSVKGTTVSLLS